MQKTVREIIDMINNHELHYNQSTQRKFVYADLSAQLQWGVTTKAGSLINAILEEHIQLPAVYFWHNSETGHTNIHDGKQRLLSLYYFINPVRGVNISTFRNGRPTFFNALSREDQEMLLNYTFDIVERTGTSKEEERSFFMINKNSVNLTDYECLSGMYHGTWLNEFEAYIDAMSRTLDGVKSVGRGEQAYKFLYAIFNICNPKRKEQQSNIDSDLNAAVSAVRNTPFDAEAYSFDKIINCFSKLMREIKGIKEERAVAIANFIVRSGYDVDNIVDYYRVCMRQANDITVWDMSIHKTFINAFIQGRRLDPKRFFTKDVKDTLYVRSPRCAHVNEDGTRCSETSYSKLEVDHILAWEAGGRTSIDNAQLMCKQHNASKRNRTLPFI